MNKILEDWDEIELGKILNFQKKSKHKAADGKEEGKYKFFTSSNMQVKFIDEFDFDGECLIFGTGGSASLHYCNEKISTTADCLVAKINDSSINTKFVYNYLIGNFHLLEAGFRGAGLKHISKSYIQKIKIKIPKNNRVQRKIVEILEKANYLRELRKESDKLTGDYIKSIFLEMFGDPGKNEKGWEKHHLKDLIAKGDKINYGVVQPGDNLPNGIPIIRVADIQNMKINMNNLKKIAPTIEKNHSKSRLIGDEIIIACVGSIGKVGIMNMNQKGCNIVRATARVRCSEKINRLYLAHYLSTPFIQSYFQKATRTVSQPTLNIKQIEETSILLPPLSLQNNFSEIVKKTEQMRAYQKSSEQQIDDLFNVLMQKAFRGELVC